MLERKSKLFLLIFSFLIIGNLSAAIASSDQEIIQATRYGHEQKVRQLLMFSVDLSVKDNKGQAALFYACQAQQIPLKWLSQKEEQDRLKVLSLIRKRTMQQRLLGSLFLKHDLHEKALLYKIAGYL